MSPELSRGTWTAVAFAVALVACASTSPPSDAESATSTPDAGATPASPAPSSSPDAETPPPAQLTVLGCDDGYGKVGAVFDGVPVYCQEDSTDGYYQCDELANRFMREALGHDNIDNVVTEQAWQMCDKVRDRSDYSAWGPAPDDGAGAYRDTAGKQPVPGDLVVFNRVLPANPPGHVAVVTRVTSTSVDVVQQNVTGKPTDSIAWDAATSFFAASANARCWIHAEGGAQLPAPSGPSCGCFDGDGDYCGLSILDHERWYGCTAKTSAGAPSTATLYRCEGGVFTPTRSCNDCVTESLQHALGHCADGDPCGHVPGAPDTNGAYCGSSKQHGFGGGDPDVVYECTDGVLVKTTTCPAACVVHASGPDGCD